MPIPPQRELLISLILSDDLLSFRVNGHHAQMNGISSSISTTVTAAADAEEEEEGWDTTVVVNFKEDSVGRTL